MKAETIWHWVQGVAAGAGALFGWFFGGLDGLVYALIAFAVTDYITGVLAAWARKELSSEVGAKGIAKKLTMFIIVGIGHLVDQYMLGDAGSPGGSSAIRTALIFWYTANEGLSLVENAIDLGVPVPDVLKNALAQIKKKGVTPDNEEDKQ
jgi:toxin secretion/phage lysis holin